MIINESAGSGGDALPYYVPPAQDRPAGRHAHVGRAGRHARRSRRRSTAAASPRRAWRSTTSQGRWAVENEGVAPDIEVEYTPADVIKGRDPQLERAVQEAMKLLDREGLKRVPRPQPIDRTTKRP